MPRVEIDIWTWIVLDPVAAHQPNIGVANDVLACHFYAMVCSHSCKWRVPSGRQQNVLERIQSPICKRAVFGLSVNSIALSL